MKYRLYNALLSSEESDNEDIDAFLVSEAEFEQKHESDQEEGEETLEIEENNTRSTSPENESSDDDVPISELRLRAKYYYGKNRYKWANNPPLSRVRTPRHNIVTNNSIPYLTENKRNDPISISDKLFDEDMRNTILTWTNVKITEFRDMAGNRTDIIAHNSVYASL